MNFKKIHLGLLLMGILLCSHAPLVAQFTIPPVPKEQTSLYDYAALLNSSQQTALQNKLLRYADSTSTQIVVIIINTTQGEDISFLGAKWGQKWGIGQADKDNGIVILLAKDDRQIDINTGYGIETIVTDRMAEQIINRIMIPEFRKGDYYAGLDKGTDALFAALKGEFKEDRSFKEEKEFPFYWIVIIILIILVIIFRNRDGGNGGGGSIWDVIILSNMGRTGGYSGRSSGGGWSGGGSFGGGFGGGGFGGGGASGGW